jgi:transposase-like protein
MEMAHKGIEMPRELLRELGCLTADELREVISALQTMVVEALAGPEAEPDRCPRCGCERFVRCGLDKRREGGVVVGTTQRYECKGCGRSFTRRTNSLLALSKLPVEKWTRFVELESRQASLATCERELGVSATTVHYMRLRLCEVMAAATPPAECGTGDSCQVDGTYPDESMKGLGHRGGAMPRAAHRTGDEVKVPGISDLKVCVVVGVDDDGREFAELCDRGHPTDAAVRGSLAGNVGGGCAAGTDGHGAYKRVLPGLGVTNHLVFPSDGSAGRGLWRVNAAHERLSIRGFRKVV